MPLTMQQVRDLLARLQGGGASPSENAFNRVATAREMGGEPLMEGMSNADMALLDRFSAGDMVANRWAGDSPIAGAALALPLGLASGGLAAVNELDKGLTGNRIARMVTGDTQFDPAANTSPADPKNVLAAALGAMYGSLRPFEDPGSGLPEDTAMARRNAAAGPSTLSGAQPFIPPPKEPYMPEGDPNSRFYAGRPGTGQGNRRQPISPVAQNVGEITYEPEEPYVPDPAVLAGAAASESELAAVRDRQLGAGTGAAAPEGRKRHPLVEAIMGMLSGEIPVE